MGETATSCPGEESLAEFAAGALRGGEADTVEAHLDGCEDCAWLVAQLISGPPGQAPQGKSAGVPEVRAAAPAHYLLREVVGQGGMGAVYEAEDVRLGRRVALKLLLDEDEKKAGRIERFLREARITASLEHPNIVPVLEVGNLEDGSPYYTQRLVRGRTLARAIGSAKELGQRLALLPHFRDLCNAIAYAHGKGVIHRDIKPGNVLVGEFGETVVVDWGLARFRNAPLDPATPPDGSPRAPGLTVEGQAVGTPGYMSPEQASGRLDEVDERSDVFSLGAVLFEILVGRPPFTGKSDEEILKRVVSGPPPDAESPGVPPDLAAVAAKALHRERSRRYADAREMEADVAAWSEGRHVAAYRYTAFQKLQRWTLRHRATSAALLVTLLFGGGVVGGAIGRRQEQRRQRADDLIERGVRYSQRQMWDRAATYFAEAATTVDSLQARWGLALIGRTGVVPLYKLRRHTGPVRAVAFAPGGQLFASASDDRTVRLYEVQSGLERLRLDLEKPADKLAFSPGGETLIAAAGEELQLFDVARGVRTGRLPLGAPVRALALSRDGKLLAAAAGNELRVWNAAGTRELAHTRAEAPIDAAAFVESGALVFGGLLLGGARLWDIAAVPVPLGPQDLHLRELRPCARDRLALTDGARRLYLWQLKGAALESAAFLSAAADGVAAAPDCRTIAEIGPSGNLRLWDGDERLTFAGLPGASRKTLAVDFSPDGQTLAVGGADHAVRLWNLGASAVHRGHRSGHSHPTALAWSQDGKLLVSTDRAGSLQLWDPATGAALRELEAHKGAALAVAFSPVGGRWASAGDDGVRLWDAQLHEIARPLAEPTRALAFSPGGLLVAGGVDGALRIAGGRITTLLAHRGEVRALAFNADGTRFASGGADGAVLLWESQSQRLLARIEGHDDEVRALAFSPDGRMLVSGSADRTLRLWDAGDGHALGIIQGDETFWGELDAMAFTPAGTLLTSTAMHTLVLWDLNQRSALFTAGEGDNSAFGLSLSPDGKRAAILHTDGSLILQNLDGLSALRSPDEELAALMGLYKYKRTQDDYVRDEDALRPQAEKIR